MRRLRCPECSTVVTADEGEVPVCPGCGFAGRTHAPPEPEPLPEPDPLLSDPNALEFTSAEPAEESFPIEETLPLEEALPVEEAPPPALGRNRNPGIVILLTIVTMGMYGIVWTWKTAGEVDRHRGTWYASKLIRPAIVLEVVAVFLFAAGAVFHLVILPDAEPSGTTPEGDAARAAALTLYGLGMVVGLLAFVLWLAGSWRHWQAIRATQIERAQAPISPGTMLLLTLLGLFVGVLWLVMEALVQSALNRLWAGPPSEASAPWPEAQAS